MNHAATREKKGEIAKAIADYKAALAIKRMRAGNRRLPPCRPPLLRETLGASSGALTVAFASLAASDQVYRARYPQSKSGQFSG